MEIGVRLIHKTFKIMRKILLAASVITLFLVINACKKSSYNIKCQNGSEFCRFLYDYCLVG